MRILVCGSRHFDDYRLMQLTMSDVVKDVKPEDWFGITIIEGEAKGADFLARVWAKYNRVKLETYPADWKKYGPAAGPIRNKQMLDEGKPDLVIAFRYKDSRGTQNMINQATKAGIPVRIVDCV